MDIIKKHQSEIEKICQQNDIGYLGVFGSITRNEATDNSDVDLLVRFNQPKSLFDLMDIEDQFSKVLHKKIDLVTERALSKYIKPNIIKDLKTVYE